VRITRIQARLIRIPLRVPYVMSRGTVTAFTNVVALIETDDGLVGWGEAMPASLLGDAARMQAEVAERLAPSLVGEDPLEVDALVDRAIGATTDVAAVAALDLALWDLLGKSSGLPVHALLGAKVQARIPVDFTLGADRPEAMAATALRMAQQGHRGFVVKLLCRSLEEDVARVRAIRAALPDADLRADCNGGYGRDDAVAFIHAVADLGLDLVEQPVARSDLAGLAACRGRGVAIAADESLSTPADALALVRANACDVLNVKVPKAGGLRQARRIAAIAAEAGLPLVVGGGLSFGISRFASRHLAASATAAVGIRHEGPGPASQELADDITIPPPSPPVDGYVDVPNLPGLGFDVAEDRLARHAV